MQELDLTLHPFTTRGTYLKITALTGTKSGRLMIGTAQEIPFLDLATRQWPHDYYEIALLRDGRECTYRWHATAERLELVCDQGCAVFAFDPPDTIVFEASGVALRLLPSHTTATCICLSERERLIGDYRGWCVHQVAAGNGASIDITECPTAGGDTGPFGDKGRMITIASPDGKSTGMLRFAPYATAMPSKPPALSSVITARRKAWAAWLGKMPCVAPRYREAAHYAWHLLYSLEVPVGGRLTRRPILMSKLWMNRVWAWDNCFDALGVCRADPQLAFDQLRLYYDNQAPTGQFADTMSSCRADFVYCKPPVYGWTMLELIRQLGVKRCMGFIRESYGPVSRLTEWWYTLRDRDRNGMCEYYHGNDSGWDNSTLFDQGYPTDGADLAAWLVLQTEALSVMAGLLGKKKEAAQWMRRSRRQMRLLLKNVRNDRFISPLSLTGKAAPARSLLNYIPMVLGRRLPERIRKAMAADLSPGGPYLTEYGLATEPVSSSKYQHDGYWRGPIWAPSTYLLFTGLVDAGEEAPAGEIARRFCDLCVKSPGMWENFDPQTGKGLCCPAYSWTAAVFLLMAHWLERGRTR